LGFDVLVTVPRTGTNPAIEEEMQGGYTHASQEGLQWRKNGVWGRELSPYIQEVRERLGVLESTIHEFSDFVNRRCSKCGDYVPKDSAYPEAY
jgi:hypothetical protein